MRSAAQRVSRDRRRGIDDQVAIGLAAIGAEIGEPAFQHAAGQRGVDRDRRDMGVADIDFGGGNLRLQVDIVQSAEVDRGIAPRLRARLRRCALDIATSSRWKSRSSFTSGLLAISTDAQPLNAPSPSAPVRPLIITTEPLSRTSALADSGSATGRAPRNVISTGMFCRSIGRRRRRRLDDEFERVLAGARVAGDPDVAIGVDDGVGVDAVDAIGRRGRADWKK